MKPQKNSQPSSATTANKKSRASGPVVRAFDVLKCISEGTYALSDIAQKCGLSYSTTHGLLQKLKRANAVTYDPIIHRYYMGSLIPQLNSNLLFTHQYLISSSLDEMKELAAYTGVTITLVVLTGFKVFRINMIHGNHPLRITDVHDEPNIEETFLSAPGKILFSQLSEDTLRKMARFIKPNSTQSPEATYNEIMADIKQARSQGYAISSGVRLQGVSCISVPVQNYSLPVVLNIIGPDSQIKHNTKKFVERALKTAADISGKLCRL
jgi:DNA-binding IclR family transcriptional regulator